MTPHSFFLLPQEFKSGYRILAASSKQKCTSQHCSMKFKDVNMKPSYVKTRFVALLVLVIPAMLSMNSIVVALTPTQVADKSLDIERYSDEPLELIEIKIRHQPIKDKVARKSWNNGVGLDTVTFKEQDGWFRYLHVKLRNVSGKPIYGVRAHLFFKPPHTKTLFSLPLAGSTQLGQGILEPGADITLMVTEQAWSLTSDILKHYDMNPDQVPVSFGVDVVRFSDDLQWSKGQMLRRDPASPNRWIAAGCHAAWRLPSVSGIDFSRSAMKHRKRDGVRSRRAGSANARYCRLCMERSSISNCSHSFGLQRSNFVDGEEESEYVERN